MKIRSQKDYQKKIDELFAENQKLGREKDKIREKQAKIHEEMSRLVAHERARQALEALPEEQRDVFVEGVTAIAKSQGGDH